MKKSILLIGMDDHGKVSLAEAITNILAVKGLSEKDIIIVDTDDNVRKKLEEIYPEEKQKPFNFVIKAYDPMPQAFIDKPVKPKHNSRFNGKKKFF